jgi:hypothetical protein
MRIKVMLPAHLRTLAHVSGDVELEVGNRLSTKELFDKIMGEDSSE